MRKRNTPCTECRHTRRKCSFTPGSFDCDRCLKLEKICIQSEKLDSDSDFDNDNADVEQLSETLESLQRTIVQMEAELNRLRKETNHHHHHYSDSDSDSQSEELTLAHYQQSNQGLFEAIVENLSFQWQVQIKNGSFQIETGIRSVHDLLHYYLDSIQYLSPISNMSSFDDNPENYRGKSDALIQFGQQMKGKGPLIPFTVKLLILCSKLKFNLPRSFPMPSQLQSRIVVDQLVKIYFSCHNTYSLLLHEKLFMSNYRQLEDPLSDPLTLSICSHVCSTPCSHVFYTTRERRTMSDYFYYKAKKLILDQFDEHEKRLENVICINILTRYMQVTMKFQECRKLITMAHQICLDLKNEFPLVASSGDFTCGLDVVRGSDLSDASIVYPFGSEAYKKCLDHVLFSRQIAPTLVVRRLMDFISNKAVDESSFFFPRRLYMGDETEQTKRFVHSQNWVLSMFNHPFVGNILNQILKLQLGLDFSLTFESIVRLEDVIDEWFRSIPPSFCLTKDYKDEEKCRNAIDKCSDCTILLTFIHFHVFIVGVFTSLLQPITLGKNNDFLLPAVQKASLDHALKGCRLLLYALLRIFQIEEVDNQCQFTLAGCEFLIRTIDAILILSLSRNEYIATESKRILRESLNQLDKVKFVQEHRVPVRSSPIHLGLMKLEDPESLHLEYYDQCPHPWFALVYDASHYVAFSPDYDEIVCK